MRIQEHVMQGGIDSVEVTGQKTGGGIKVLQGSHLEWGFKMHRASKERIYG